MLYRFRGKWRHFGPHMRHLRHSRGDYCEADCVTPGLDGDEYEVALARVKRKLQRRPEPKDLERRLGNYRAQAVRTNVTSDWLALLFASAPRSVLAQQQMDRHPHGYHDKQARLFELIDFNDTFVAAVLSLSDGYETFSARAREGCNAVCQLTGAPLFSDEQWDAIVRGLSREIAVYLAAKHNGFYAYMTNRTQDALGIDMQIKDPESQRYINIDVKSANAFRHRLEDLVHEDRLTEQQLVEADQRSYAIEINGHGEQKVPIIVLSILPDKFGEITNFCFVDETPMRDMLAKLIGEHGLHDNNYGLEGLSRATR